MIEVKIDKKTIKVDPRLTIERYQKIQKNPQKYESTTNILALYLDIEPEELKNLPVDQIKYLEQVLTKHLTDETKPDIVLAFEFEGVHYGFENDWNNITWGQWSDLEIFSQQDNITDNIHILMSLLYRPIIINKGKTYKLEKFKADDVLERAEIFKQLPVEYWFGCATFFLHLSTIFINDMQNSLKANLLIQKYLNPMRKILPNWLLPKVPQDSISNYLTNLSKGTSQNTAN